MWLKGGKSAPGWGNRQRPSWRGRGRAPRAHELLELVAAVLVVPEHVEAGEARAEEGHGRPARPRPPRAAPLPPGWRKRRAAMPVSAQAAARRSAVSPMRKIRRTRGVIRRTKAARSPPLALPPAIRSTGFREALERRLDRVKIGRLRVVPVVDPADFGHVGQPVLPEAEGARRRVKRGLVEPARAPPGGREEEVLPLRIVGEGRAGSSRGSAGWSSVATQTKRDSTSRARGRWLA